MSNPSGTPYPSAAPPYSAPAPGVQPPYPTGAAPPPTVYAQPAQPIPVIVSQPTPALGPVSCNVLCPHCNQCVLTEIEFRAGLLTWIIFAILLLIGCWLGCCLIPFCVQDCQDVEHRCPNCHTTIGVYKRMS